MVEYVCSKWKWFPSAFKDVKHDAKLKKAGYDTSHFSEFCKNRNSYV